MPQQGRRGHNLTNVWGQLVRTAFCCVPCAEVGEEVELLLSCVAEVTGGGDGRARMWINTAGTPRSKKKKRFKLDIYQNFFFWTPDELKASVSGRGGGGVSVGVEGVLKAFIKALLLLRCTERQLSGTSILRLLLM